MPLALSRRAGALSAALALALLTFPHATAWSAPALPSSGMAGAGGHAAAGSLQLTFALGQVGGGPLAGGSIDAVAQWLRKSPGAVLDAGPAPGAGGAIEFAAYPNPGAERIVLRFTSGTPTTSDVRLEIFDVSGRLVRRVADGRFSAGRHEVTWDGRDAGGRRVPAGLYLCRLREGAVQHVRRLEIVH